jgi:hypothetical protein
MQSFNENSIQLFTIAQPLSLKPAALSNKAINVNKSASAAKYGAVPVQQRGASVVTMAAGQNMGDNQAMSKLQNIATSVTDQFDQFIDNISPQPQQYQFAGAGPMPVFDSSDYSKFK